MNREEYVKLVRESLERRLALGEKKGADYANEDILSNFKRIGEGALILRIPQLWMKHPAYAYARLMDMLKQDRITNLLLKDAEPKNESKRDTLDDEKNYVDLAEALLVEMGLV